LRRTRWQPKSLRCRHQQAEHQHTRLSVHAHPDSP
jgi:hypothetical protein